VDLDLCDGKRFYSKEGPWPPSVSDAGPTDLSVNLLDGGPLFNKSNWPTHYQWFPVFEAGPSVLLKDDPQAMPGTIALRKERGNTRRDIYLDPARDYICVQCVSWKKRSDKWEKEREDKLLDLRQLPEGPWYATKRFEKTYGSPERKTRGHEITWNLDFRLLGKDEFPPDCFNGSKVLEDSKQEDAKIETY
jgi:hypothetical protein